MPTPRLSITAAARRAVVRIRREVGPQAVFLSWPAGATYVPAASYVPGEFDVIVGHVARCPIYADVRQLGFYGDRSAVLDVHETRHAPWPVLRMRDRQPTSEPEDTSRPRAS